MSYLILGGTGTVGSALVDELIARGEGGGGRLRVMTRSEEKAGALPEGAEAVIADMTAPETFEAGAFQGAERLFLLNPVSPSELQEGLFALEEAKRAGTRHIVYLSVHEVEKGPHLPHFASKMGVEAALKESGIPYTILRPNNYYQNDHWFRDAIVEHGIYPQPIGDVGISRVDIRDIAEAAANAFTRGGFENRTCAIVGPKALTGEDCARAYAEALGREVAYGGNDLDAWEGQARQTMPAWMAYDFRLMYAVFQEEGLVATEEQLEETREIVGREPRRFEDFVREAVEGWR